MGDIDENDLFIATVVAIESDVVFKGAVYSQHARLRLCDGQHVWCFDHGCKVKNEMIGKKARIVVYTDCRFNLAEAGLPFHLGVTQPDAESFRTISSSPTRMYGRINRMREQEFTVARHTLQYAKFTIDCGNMRLLEMKPCENLRGFKVGANVVAKGSGRIAHINDIEAL